MMRITERIVQDVVVLDLEGRMLNGDNQLPAAVAALAAAGQLKVLLNLAGVSYWERLGFDELATSLITIKQTGGVLKLLKPRRQFREVLEAAHLASALEIHDDEDAALRSFADSPVGPATHEAPGR
jgi:anti-anti-sigma factor